MPAAALPQPVAAAVVAALGSAMPELAARMAQADAAGRPAAAGAAGGGAAAAAKAGGAPAPSAFEDPAVMSAAKHRTFDPSKAPVFSKHQLSKNNASNIASKAGSSGQQGAYAGASFEGKAPAASDVPRPRFLAAKR